MSHWIVHYTDSFKKRYVLQDWNTTTVWSNGSTLTIFLGGVKTDKITDIIVFKMYSEFMIINVWFIDLLLKGYVNNCTCCKDISDITFERDAFGWFVSNLIRK